MESFPPRKRLKTEFTSTTNVSNENNGSESTDVKLALLASLFPDAGQDLLLDCLVANDGSVDATCSALSEQDLSQTGRVTKASSKTQTSLFSYGVKSSGNLPQGVVSQKPVTKKGKTLHLYSPEDIARHTPCSVVHNFLPPEDARELLLELLEESRSFSRHEFQLFDTPVQSPHSSAFYVSSLEEQRQQQSEYLYNGRFLNDVRQMTPLLGRVSSIVQGSVNNQIQKRIQTFYPDGQKLKYQSPREWVPNVAVVNCYDGPRESVGYHSDELTYLGPRAVIGSLSLGVTREFRIRKVVPPDDEQGTNIAGSDSAKATVTAPASLLSQGDIQGQIAIHLPHNSLLVMHAEMQEEWKHSINSIQSISPHPISANKRINVTYRWYRDSFHPRNTPRCRCGMPCVLRCVQRKRENRGRYMWMCYAGFAPGKSSCSFFKWADFNQDGDPIWDDSNSKELK